MSEGIGITIFRRKIRKTEIKLSEAIQMGLKATVEKLENKLFEMISELEELGYEYQENFDS